MRVLLLGANGMLACDLIREAPGAHDIVGRDIDDFDITDPHAVHEAVHEIQPDLIVNAAAYTNVDGAESEPDLAFAVNGDAPGFIGSAAKALGVPVVHYSTDYVFDGSSREPYGEDESTSPMGVYGASKLRGEHRLLDSGGSPHHPHAMVVRHRRSLVSANHVEAGNQRRGNPSGRRSDRKAHLHGGFGEGDLGQSGAT